MTRILVTRIVLVGLLVSLGPFDLRAQKLLPDATNDLARDIVKQVAKERKSRIAVVPFRELGGQSTVLGTYLAEKLVTDLVNSGNLDLVERSTLDKIMGELKLNESGAIDPATAKRVGKLVGAEAIVTGTITDFQTFIAVNCRLIDTETGHIFAAAEARIVKDDDVKKVMNMSLTGSAISAENSTKSVSGRPASSAPAHQISAEQDRFVFAIRSCSRSGSTLICSGFVNNKAENRRNLNIEYQSASVVDDLGNLYTVNVRKFSFRTASPGTIVTTQELEPELPINFVLGVDDLNPSATRVSIILTVYVADGGVFKISLRDIPLEKK
jgi:curli biogenesis system outer membrane secretion channel CsgG